MKKLGIILGCVVILVGMMVAPGMAKKSDCTTIQDGLVDSAGNPLVLGYDEFGYNYQAHMFNGRYCDSDREIGGAYCDVNLIMKWNDAWLSNKDCNGDGELDRGYSCDPVNANSSACAGAWLTNHQRGSCIDDDGKEHNWTYFVKIVYPPGGVVDDDNDGYDDNTGGSIIWTSYVRIQQVSNDPCLDEHGRIFAVNPAGFGAYK